RSYGKRDLMVLRQRFKSNLMVSSGLAKASWLQYQKTGNKNDLVNSVQEAWNNYYLLISRLEESDYDDLKGRYALPESRYTDARMSVALRLLEIAYERGDYKDIITSVANFENSGWLAACSASLQSKFKALRQRALAKK
ncbi:MAG: hypothetical protein P1V97_32220, partial [Planctomycetota bacterium]|nr:hypothetical protein [Planctomycetota bacterium]